MRKLRILPSVAIAVALGAALPGCSRNGVNQAASPAGSSASLQVSSQLSTQSTGPSPRPALTTTPASSSDAAAVPWGPAGEVLAIRLRPGRPIVTADGTPKFFVDICSTGKNKTYVLFGGEFLRLEVDGKWYHQGISCFSAPTFALQPGDVHRGQPFVPAFYFASNDPNDEQRLALAPGRHVFRVGLTRFAERPKDGLGNGGVLIQEAMLSNPLTVDVPAPASTRPSSGWWEEDTDWSESVNGLRVKIEVSRSLTRLLGLQASSRFWNTSTDNMAIRWDSDTYRWEVRDASGKVIVPEKPSVKLERAELRWYTLTTTDRGNVGHQLSDGQQSRNGVLQLGNWRWKLPPGKYALRCTFTSHPEGAERPPSGAKVWQGSIVVPPVEFTVYPDVSDEELKAARAKVISAPHEDDVTLYNELADLVTPGMTMAQLQLVLPPGRGGYGMGFWSGNFWSFEYPIDLALSVRACGFGARDGNQTVMVLTSRPLIVPSRSDPIVTQTPASIPSSAATQPAN